MEISIYIESNENEPLDILELFLIPKTKPDFEEEVPEQYLEFFKNYQYVPYPTKYLREGNRMVIYWNWLEADLERVFSLIALLKVDKLMGTSRHPELATEEWDTALLFLVFREGKLYHAQSPDLAEDQLYETIENSYDSKTIMSAYLKAFSTLALLVEKNNLEFSDLC